MKKSKYAFPLLLLSSFGSQAAVELNNEQQLGKLLFEDKNLSLNKNQACASCHSLLPARGNGVASLFVPGFVDPDNAKNGTPVSAGSLPDAFGGLNAPSAGYAGFSPLFHWDEAKGAYVGGQFWNGRAVDLKEQAQKPFLNPGEMAMPSEWAVVDRIKEQSVYGWYFSEVYGINLDNIPTYSSNDQTPDSVLNVFTLAAQALAAFEKTAVFNKFTSKYDYVLAGKTKLTATEAKGLALFNGKANCSACHSSEMTYDQFDEPIPPLFTDFTYDNIGLPRNLKIPNNPEPNLGLGGRSDITDASQIGKHKVMSLRNIALTPPYGHNGVFKTLEQIVHFYNTRDILGWAPDNISPKFGTEGWPTPEVIQNVNQFELGNLGLTSSEEKAIVAFLKTLTDDYQIWGMDWRVPIWTPAPFDTLPQ